MNLTKPSPAETQLLQRLATSERRVRQIVDSALDAVVAIDAKGLVTDWNKQAEVMFGWSRDEAVGQPMASLIIPPAYRMAHHQGLERYLATGQGAILNARIEIVAVRRDGTSFPIELTVTPQADFVGDNPIPQGEVYFTAFVRDITMRVGAERAMRDSEERWRTLTEAMPQLVWIAQPDGAASYFSTQWATYTGVPVADLIGARWLDMIHPDDVAATTAAWAAATADIAPYNIDYRIRRHDGIYHWFKTRGVPTRDEDGKIVAWYGTCTDIEEQKQAAEAMRMSREHLKLMVASAKDFAIISMDLTGSVISWNPGAERIFGYMAADVIGKPAAIIFTPEDRAALIPEQEFTTARQYGSASDERWHIRENGERFYASGIMAAMYDENETITGFTKIARDMTEQKHAEQLLIEARNSAEAANIAKSEFLANMSHEIRTPMNAIIGLSNILATGGDLSPRQLQYVSTLQMSADTLLSLINDLLDIAKIEARSVALEQIPFSITQLVQEVISMMAVRTREKNLTFTMDAACAQQRLFVGDPTRLRQIIANLCSNAVKFTESGGVYIVITCQPTDRANIESINIAVKDTGIGIAAEHLVSIFDKFIQADSSINRKYGGTGLGLAITKTLVEIMGGTIAVDSNLGHGSTFTVNLDLPVAENIVAAAVARDMPAPTADSRQQPLVLLVEDYPANILVATSFLENFGYRHDVATNGIAAIEKVKGNDYYAVLMDVQMHGINGFETTRLIREYEKQYAKVPLTIIGMTAHALAGDRERCLDAGMDDYISKPFNPDELKRKLQALTKF